GAFPLSQLQPASATMFARVVVKLRLGGVSRRATPLPISATQSADPAGVLVMKARSFPSRDQSRSTIFPDNPEPLTRRVRPLCKSTTSTDIVPLEMVVYASLSPLTDHTAEPRRPPAGTSRERSILPSVLLTVAV